MKALITSLLIILAHCPIHAKEYHVSITGLDGNQGSSSKPFRTISAAAQLAQAGDTITVHEGVYREWVNPPRGGTSNDNRIVYQAAAGERVVIKGSEIVKGWERVQDAVWKVTLPNHFFGDFNPYSDVISGHWFNPKDREHHTGAVYLNGDWLDEAESTAEVLAEPGDKALWFGRVDSENTTIWAQFPSVDPNKERVEINVRQSVFFPEQAGLNYITVRGFTMRDAATPWAPPTMKQIGLIGPHWSKGWIIENNTISHSTTVCVQLGLGDVGLSVVGTGIGYAELANHVVSQGLWTKEKIGSHVVRGNRISHCEAAGVNGSFGAAFSLIEKNEIYDIHRKMLYAGMEQGGIKLHAAIDVVIRENVVYRTGRSARGIWLDWMGQGAIIHDNLVFETQSPALYLEVNHGPILVANNILVSDVALSNRSRGTAYVHNFFGGEATIGNTVRITPYMEPHTTDIAGMHNNYPGDDRFYNNIFAGRTEPGKTTLREENRPPTKPDPPARYEDETLPLAMEGNLYLNGSVPHEQDLHPMVLERQTAALQVVRKEDGFYIEWNSDPAWIRDQERRLVSTEMLGRARVPDMKYENADGSPVRIDTDYFGNTRNVPNPTPGPFTKVQEGKRLIRVWPKQSGLTGNLDELKAWISR